MMQLAESEMNTDREDKCGQMKNTVISVNIYHTFWTILFFFISKSVNEQDGTVVSCLSHIWVELAILTEDFHDIPQSFHG
jgi:hypothetical protein